MDEEERMLLFRPNIDKSQQSYKSLLRSAKKHR